MVIKLLQLLIIRIKYLRKANVFPEPQRLLQLSHHHHRPVQCADRGACHIKAHVGLVQRPPDTDLIRTLCAAALQGNGVGFRCIQPQLHFVTSAYFSSSARAACITLPAIGVALP